MSRTSIIALIVLALVIAVPVGSVLYLRHLLTAESLTALLNDALTPATDGLYRIHINSSTVSLRRGSLQLDQVTVDTDLERLGELRAADAGPAIRFSVTVDRLAIDGVGLWRLLSRRDLVADSITVRSADVRAVVDSARESTPIETSEVPAAPAQRIRAVLDGMPTIAIDLVTIDNASLRVESTAAAEGVAAETVDRSDVIGRIDVEFEMLRIDAEAVKREDAGFYSDDVRVRIYDVDTSVSDDYSLRVGEVRGSSRDARIEVTALELNPTASVAEYLARPRRAESDRIDMSARALVLDGMALSRYLANLEVIVREVSIDGLQLHVLTDKGKPKTSVGAPAWMPHTLLQGSRQYVTVEQLDVRGEVTYSEQRADAPVRGDVVFADVAVSARNLSNDPSRMSDETPASVNATTKINGAISARVEWRLPLLATAPRMSVSGSIASFDPTALNRTTVPLSGVEVASGHVDSLQFAFDYTPSLVVGTVEVYYKDLDIRVVDPVTGRRNVRQHVVSFLANAFAVNHNNPSRPGRAPRVGTINLPVEPSDSFFGLLWVPVRTGLMSIIR